MDERRTKMMNIPRIVLALALLGAVSLADMASAETEVYSCETRTVEGLSKDGRTDVHNNSTKTLDVQIWRGKTIKKTVRLEPGAKVEHKLGFSKSVGSADVLVRIGSTPTWSDYAICRYSLSSSHQRTDWSLPEGASDVCPDVRGVKVKCEARFSKRMHTEFWVSDPN
jgi:hypothetical protein